MAENIKKKSGDLVVVLISILFVIFGGICLFLAISTKRYTLIASAVACVLTAITMNIAQRIRISRHSSTTLTIISAILAVISIPMLFIFNIYSLVFSIPALILSLKLAKLGKNVPAIVVSIASAILVAISVLIFLIKLI